jgi:hypothetical protein
METIDQTRLIWITILLLTIKNTQLQQGLFWKNATDAMFFNSFHEGIHIRLFWVIGSLFFKLLK